MLLQYDSDSDSDKKDVISQNYSIEHRQRSYKWPLYKLIAVYITMESVSAP
jgi:hypothetical protein